jgi:hypothetical protein
MGSKVYWVLNSGTKGITSIPNYKKQSLLQKQTADQPVKKISAFNGTPW